MLVVREMFGKYFLLFYTPGSVLVIFFCTYIEMFFFEDQTSFLVAATAPEVNTSILAFVS